MFYQTRQKYRILLKTICIFLCAVFCEGVVCPLNLHSAFAAGELSVPLSGGLVALSPSFTPLILRGMKIFPEKPLNFDFIVDSGDTGLKGDDLKAESEKLIRYFLASLTLPEDELWVNLSPYEKDRIVPDTLGSTEMGRDMLAQDYLLKQITASLTNPDSDLGKDFWSKVYQKAYEQYGTTNIPVDTFNKVWIMPEKAEVYVQDDPSTSSGQVAAFIVDSKLKVMMEEDYVALEKSKENGREKIEDGKSKNETNSGKSFDSLGSKTFPSSIIHPPSSSSSPSFDISTSIVREVFIPALEKEVNTGKNFAKLRQIYHSLILATWFKEKIRNSFLNQAYADQGKVRGIDTNDKNNIQGVYQQYLSTFKKGVMNFMRVEYDAYAKKSIARKYFSGGVSWSVAPQMQYVSTFSGAMPSWTSDATLSNIRFVIDPVGLSRIPFKQQSSSSVQNPVPVTPEQKILFKQYFNHFMENGNGEFQGPEGLIDYLKKQFVMTDDQLRELLGVARGMIKPWLTAGVKGTLKPKTLERIIERFGLDQEAQQRFLWRCARGDKSLTVPGIIDKWQKEIFSRSAKGLAQEEEFFSQIFSDLWAYAGFSGEYIQQKLGLSELDTVFSWRDGMAPRDYENRVKLAKLFEPYDEKIQRSIQLLLFGVATNETAKQLLDRVRDPHRLLHFGDIVRMTRLSQGLRRADLWELLEKADNRLQGTAPGTGVAIIEGIENGGRLRFRTDVAESLADWLGFKDQDKKDFVELVRKKFTFSYDPQILRSIDRFDDKSRQEGLVKLRKNQGWTQEDVQQQIGISHTTYSHFESSGGSVRSPVIDLDTLAQLFGIPVEDRPLFKEIYGRSSEAVAYDVVADPEGMKKAAQDFFAAKQNPAFPLEKWFRKIDRGARSREKMNVMTVKSKEGMLGLALFHEEKYPLDDVGQISFRVSNQANQQVVYTLDLLEMADKYSNKEEFQKVLSQMIAKSRLEGLSGVIVVDPQDFQGYQAQGKEAKAIFEEIGFEKASQGYFERIKEIESKGFVSISLSRERATALPAVASSGLSFKQHAKNLIDVITPRSSLEQLKEVYGNLGNVHPFSSAAEAVYNAATSNTRMDVLTASDISQVADIFVAEFVKEFQAWQTSADSQENIIVHFATGATPWISYRKLADILETWETPQTQEFLRRAGVDATQKPDMTRVEAYCLDAILPQKRTDYHAFANKLNNVWDLLRIPQDQRHLLYGDLIMQQGQPRPATEKEFESLMQDVKQNGFQLKKYKAGKLAMESIQYKFFKAIEQEAQAMSGNLTQQGGGHIVIWGVGPSYEGKGHLAFMEEGTPIDQKVFLDNAGFFVQADHAKENGGFDNMAQLGFVTLGFYELLYRQNAKHILLATSNSKRNAIYKAVEGKSKEDFSRFPVTALQDQRGVVIASGGADANLRLKRHFWHYELIDEWTPEMIRQMFVRLADDISKPLLSLEENDFFALDVGHPMINRIREENLKSLKRQGSFEELKQQVAKGITQNILNPYDFPEKLGWKAGEKKNVVIINPHLDDDYLAGIAHLLKENSSFIGNAEVYYTAKGITAVSDSYVGQILEHMRSWDQAKILSVLAKTDKDIALEIIPILEKQNLHTDAEDYDVWTQMSAQEKDLRAQTLFLDAMREFMPQDDNVDSLNDVIDFLQAVMATKPSWGARDIDLLTTIKEVIRVFENRTALMSLGFAFENIHAPMDSTWYGQEGRGTAKEQDIERIQKILREKRPDLIISNGEGFSDYGAHSTTEASVIAAMENLFEEGVLDVNKIHYLTYAGVWDRTKLSDEDVLSIVMTTETLSLLDQGFRQHYPSQSPAPVPDPGFGKPTFFSKAVFANARISRSEIRRLFPEYFKDHLILSQEGSGVLNYRLINLKDPLTQQRLIDKVKELKRVRDDLARSSDFVINGPAPLPDLLTKDRKRFQLFLTALSLTEEEILSGIKPGDIASSQEVSNELPKISSGLTAKVYRPEDALQKMLVDGFVELKTAEGNKIKFTFQEISSKGYRIFAYEGDKKLGYCDFQKNEIAIGHYQAEAIMVFTTAGYSGLGRAMMSLVLAFAKAQGLESFGAKWLRDPSFWYDLGFVPDGKNNFLSFFFAQKQIPSIQIANEDAHRLYEKAILFEQVIKRNTLKSQRDDLVRQAQEIVSQNSGSRFIVLKEGFDEIIRVESAYPGEVLWSASQLYTKPDPQKEFAEDGDMQQKIKTAEYVHGNFPASRYFVEKISYPFVLDTGEVIERLGVRVMVMQENKEASWQAQGVSTSKPQESAGAYQEEDVRTAVDQLITDAVRVMPRAGDRAGDWQRFSQIIERLGKEKNVEVVVVGGRMSGYEEIPIAHKVIIDDYVFGISSDKLGFKDLSARESLFLKHLLDNAVVQHVPDGVALVVREKHKGYQRISVIDNGRGFLGWDNQPVSIAQAALFNKRFGVRGKDGIGLTLALRHGADFTLIDEVNEWAVVERGRGAQGFAIIKSGSRAKSYGTAIEGYFLTGLQVFKPFVRKKIRTLLKTQEFSVEDVRMSFAAALKSNEDQMPKEKSSSTLGLDEASMNRLKQVISKYYRGTSKELGARVEWFLPYKGLGDDLLDKVVREGLKEQFRSPSTHFSLEPFENRALRQGADVLARGNLSEVIVTTYGGGFSLSLEKTAGDEALEFEEALNAIISAYDKQGKKTNIVLTVYDFDSSSLGDYPRQLKGVVSAYEKQYPGWKGRIAYRIHYGNILDRHSWQAMATPSHITFWRHTWVGDLMSDYLSYQKLSSVEMEIFADLLAMNIHQGALIVRESTGQGFFRVHKVISDKTQGEDLKGNVDGLASSNVDAPRGQVNLQAFMYGKFPTTNTYDFLSTIYSLDPVKKVRVLDFGSNGQFVQKLFDQRYKSVLENVYALDIEKLRKMDFNKAEKIGETDVFAMQEMDSGYAPDIVDKYAKDMKVDWIFMNAPDPGGRMEYYFKEIEALSARNAMVFLRLHEIDQGTFEKFRTGFRDIGFDFMGVIEQPPSDYPATDFISADYKNRMIYLFTNQPLEDYIDEEKDQLGDGRPQERAGSSAIVADAEVRNRLSQMILKYYQGSDQDVESRMEWFLPYVYLEDSALERIVREGLTKMPFTNPSNNFMLNDLEVKALWSSAEMLARDNVQDVVITTYGGGEFLPKGSLMHGGNTELEESLEAIIQSYEAKGEKTNIALVVYDYDSSSLRDYPRQIRELVSFFENKYPTWKNRIQFHCRYGNIFDTATWQAMATPSHITFWRHTWVGDKGHQEYPLDFESMNNFAKGLEGSIRQGVLIVKENTQQGQLRFQKMIGGDVRQSESTKVEDKISSNIAQIYTLKAMSPSLEDEYSIYSGFSGHNSREFTEGGKAILSAAVSAAQGRSLRVCDLGAGSGRAVSQISEIMQEYQKSGAVGDYGIDTVSLTKIPANVLIKRGYDQINGDIVRYFRANPAVTLEGFEKYINERISFLPTTVKMILGIENGEGYADLMPEQIDGVLRTKLAAARIPLELLFDLQEKGYEVFEVFKKPFINEQHIGSFLSSTVEFDPSVKYDFLYEDHGAVYYSLEADPSQTLKKAFSLLSDHGILFFDLMLKMHFELALRAWPLGFVGIRSAGKLIVFRENSLVHQKVKELLSASNNLAENVYQVDDFQKVVAALNRVLRDEPMTGQQEDPQGKELGGIDFNTQKMNMQVEGDNVEFVIPPEFQGIDLNSIEGFVPVIINITPIMDIFPFLGFSKEEAQKLQRVQKLDNARDPEKLSLVH